MKFKKLFRSLFVILIFTTILFIFYFRVSLFNYNTSKDYQYNFNRTDSRKIEVQLIDGKLIFQ